MTAEGIILQQVNGGYYILSIRYHNFVKSFCNQPHTPTLSLSVHSASSKLNVRCDPSAPGARRGNLI